MKATLEYDLTDYSEKLMHRRATNAENAYLALSAIQDMLGREGKNFDEYSTAYTAIEELNKEFYEILYRNGINLDEDIE